MATVKSTSNEQNLSLKNMLTSYPKLALRKGKNSRPLRIKSFLTISIIMFIMRQSA